jgi:hypothetical protein
MRCHSHERHPIDNGAGGEEAECMEQHSTVWVYHYRFWNPRTNEMLRASRAATLDAIKSGLGVPIVDSGRKIPAGSIDEHGRERGGVLPDSPDKRDH